MSQRVISEAEPLGKAMGFRVSAEGLDGLDGKAAGFGVSAEGLDGLGGKSRLGIWDKRDMEIPIAP